MNNAHFVYFGMKIVDPRQPKFAKLKAYADQILNALEIQQGPSHMEVKYNDTYQVLIIVLRIYLMFVELLVDCRNPAW